MTRPRTHRRKILAVTATILSMLGLAACSGTETAEVDPIEVVSSAEQLGEPISLDIPLHESGAFEFDRWPSACALADETTLQSIFPQADEVAHTPRSKQIRVLHIGGGNGGDAGPFTVEEAECVTNIGFPVEGLRLADQNVVVSFTTAIEAAGSAEFVKNNTAHRGGEEVEVAGAACVKSVGHRYDCRTEQISFSVSVDARPYGQYVDGDSVYVIDGEEIDYSGDVDAFQAMADEKILLPVVTAAVERLSA